MRMPGRETLGKIALATGGIAAAATAVGVAIFGAQQFHETTRTRPVAYERNLSNDEAMHKMLGGAISEVDSDMKHLMGGLGAFALLMGTGVGLVAYGSHRSQQEREDVYEAAPEAMYQPVDPLGPDDTEYGNYETSSATDTIELAAIPPLHVSERLFGESP